MAIDNGYLVLGPRILHFPKFEAFSDLDPGDGNTRYAQALKILEDRATGHLQILDGNGDPIPPTSDGVLGEVTLVGGVLTGNAVLLFLIGGQWYVSKEFIKLKDLSSNDSVEAFYSNTGAPLISDGQHPHENYAALANHGIDPDKAVLWYPELEPGDTHGSLADFGG